MDDRRRERVREQKDPASDRSIPRGTDEHADTDSDDATRASDAHAPEVDDAQDDEEGDRRPTS
jgi:hypothetical protein